MHPWTPIHSTTSFDPIDGNSLDDRLAVAAVRRGTNGADTLNGTNSGDTLTGRGGRDLLNGRKGNDQMDGGNGNDRLNGGNGADTLKGGKGNDLLKGQAGSDRLEGGAGNDSLIGGGGNDRMLGGAGRDLLNGGGGNDTLKGGGGADRLLGGKGADHLQGEAGDDTLAGGNGNDTLTGGAGDDSLTGGKGRDIFTFDGQWGRDRIADFNAAQGDRIDLTGTNLAFSDLAIQDVAAGTRITAGNRTIVLEGVAATNVDPSWFRVSNTKGSVRDSEGDDSKYDVPDPDFTRSQLGTASIEQQDIVGIDDLREDARFSAYDGEGYAVVILDTGIDLDHPAFGPDANGDGISDRIVFTRDFTGEGDGTADDVNGHGSNVSSIIASSNGGYPGVVPGADIIHLQVLSNEGSGSFASIEAGLQWVVDNADAYNIVAVNMSIGDSQNVNRTATHSVFGDEFAALAGAGVITTVAAGNDYARFNAPGHSTMATDPNVIPVGAVWEGNFGSVTWGSGAKDNSSGADRLTAFTQRSADLSTVYAPGAMILGAGPGGGTIEQGGTSQAAPLVAGMAVLAQQIADSLLGRRLTPSEFHDLLIETADTIYDGDDEDDNVTNLETNLPRVNMFSLAEKIAEMAGGTTPIEVDDDYAGDTSTDGSVAIGGQRRGELETASDSDWFAVDLRAGNTYRLVIEGDSLDDPYATLHDASGRVVATNDDADGRDPAIEFTPESNGRYFLAASGYGDQTGTYIVRATRVTRSVEDDHPADDKTTSTVPVDGDPARGQIEAPGDRDWHRLDLDGGGLYEITVNGLGLDDAFMEIYDASGNSIGSDDNGAVGNNPRMVLEPKADTTYYVSVSSAVEGGTGGYRVRAETVTRGPADIPADQSTSARLTLGETFTSTISPIADRDWIKVTLSGGAVYNLALDSARNDGLGDPLIRLYDNTGRLLASDDDSGTGSNALIQAFSPSEAGTYFVSASAYNDATTGRYNLLVQEVSGGSGDIPANRTTTSQVTVGGPVTSQIDADGDRDWHLADLEPGNSYRVTLTGTGANPLADPYLRVLSTNGTLLTENDDDGLTRNSSVVITGTDAADYYLSAASYGDTGTGRYRLAIEDLGPNDDYASDSTTDGRIEGTGGLNGGIDFAGDSDWVAYFVKAGGEYQFDATGRGGNAVDPTLTLRDAFGGEIFFDDNSGGGTGARVTFTASTTGPIYLDVSGAGNDTGDWRLEAQELVSGGDDHPNGFQDNALLVPGNPISAELEQQGDADVFRFQTTAGRTYTLDMKGAPTGNGTLGDSVLGVYDSLGTLVTWNDDGPDGTTNSQVTFTAEYTGDYFAGAFGYDGTSAGTYTLSLDESGGGTTGDDYGTTPGTAGFFNESGFAFGTLENAGDRDWIAVELSPFLRYEFYLYGAPSGFGTVEDPILRLYAPDASTLIFTNDDLSEVNRESGIAFTPTTNNFYYLEVGAFDDAGAGDWTLQANAFFL